MFSWTQASLGRRHVILTVLTVVAVAAIAWSPARASSESLPLGDPDLTETRSTHRLAAGVTLTRIVRGTEDAPPDEIGTTSRGPWRVNVLTVDPDQARGHLEASYGADLGAVETTTDLVRLSGALAGVNASFFTFTASERYPGDPVGLGLYDGRLLSEPTTEPAETDLVFDTSSDRTLIGRMSWSGVLLNRRTSQRLPLEFLNHPPVVPTGCASLADPTACPKPGDVVRFKPAFGPSTPEGPGVEVVLDRRGCIARKATTRGTTLTHGQSSVQATGRETGALLQLTHRGCLAQQVSLTDSDGKRVALRPGVFGVNGRYQLVSGGDVAVPDGSGSFFERNPRTIAGTTRDGRILLVTIDGRQTTSVGTTLDETAGVARALGMHEAVNLDGGGSTTMSVRGRLVNRPSGGAQRAVGDALVYVE